MRSFLGTLIVRAISGFYVILPRTTDDPFWVGFLHDNVDSEVIYPPILRLKLENVDLALENGILKLVKAYSIDFIDFLLNNKKKNENDLINQNVFLPLHRCQ